MAEETVEDSVEDGTEGGYTAYPAGSEGAMRDYHRRMARIERTEGTQRYIDSGEYEGEYLPGTEQGPRG